jgi:hypothetical protein
VADSSVQARLRASSLGDSTATLPQAQPTTNLHPNFTGTWILRKELTDFGIPNPTQIVDVIGHSGADLTISRTTTHATGSVSSFTGVYRVDGAPYTNHAAISRLNWDGFALVIDCLRLRGRANYERRPPDAFR